MSDRSDAALMTAAGDEAIPAFSELHDRYRRRAQRVAGAVCEDADRAEDAVQDAFLSLWRARSGYRESRGTVAAWVLVSVHHRAVDAVRRERAHRRSAQVPEQNRETNSAPPNGLEAVRQAIDVRTLLSQLPESQLEVIVLAYYGQLSHSEIAEHLGLPAGTVKGRMRLGLQKLRVGLESDGA